MSRQDKRITITFRVIDNYADMREDELMTLLLEGVGDSMGWLMENLEGKVEE